MNHLHVKQLRGAETESDDQSVLSFDVSTEGDVDNLSSLSDLEDIFTPPTDSNVHHLGGKVIYLPQDSPPARQLGVVSPQAADNTSDESSFVHPTPPPATGVVSPQAADNTSVESSFVHPTPPPATRLESPCQILLPAVEDEQGGDDLLPGKVKRLRPRAAPKEQRSPSKKPKATSPPTSTRKMSTPPDNSKHPTLLDTFQKTFTHMFQSECCSEGGCNLCYFMNNRGLPSNRKKCRLHRLGPNQNCLPEREPSLKAPTNAFSIASPNNDYHWIEGNISLTHIKDSQLWSSYVFDPCCETKDARVSSRLLARFLSYVEDHLQATEPFQMGKKHPNKKLRKRFYLLPQVLLTFSQLVYQPLSTKKTRANDSNDSTGVVALIYYVLGPFVLSRCMRALGVPFVLRSGKKNIEELIDLLIHSIEHGCGNLHQNYDYHFSEEFQKRVQKAKEDEEKSVGHNLSKDWVSKMLHNISTALWSAQCFICFYITSSLFGISDGYFNLLMLSDKTEQISDKEIVFITADIAHQLRLKTQVIFRAAILRGAGQRVAAFYTTGSGSRDSAALFNAIMYPVALGMMKLLFCHGFNPEVNLSPDMKQQCSTFAEVIENRGGGSLEFESKTLSYLESMFRRIDGINGEEAKFAEAFMNSCFDFKLQKVRPLLFFTLAAIGSYAVFSLPQLEGSPFLDSWLMHNHSSKNKKQIRLKDGNCQGSVFEASKFSQFTLKSRGQSTEFIDSSGRVFVHWAHESIIAVTGKEDLSGKVCCFDFSKPLPSCMTTEERIRSFLLHSKNILEMTRQQLQDAGVTNAQLLQVRATYDHMRLLLSDSVVGGCHVVNDSACIDDDAAAENFALTLTTPTATSATTNTVPAELGDQFHAEVQKVKEKSMDSIEMMEYLMNC